MYRVGEGTNQSDEHAFLWYKKAAEQGHSDGQYAMGWVHAEGRVVAQDDDAAFKWLTLAAEQGNPSAQGSLGGMYGNGWGTERDLVTGYMWVSISILSGNEDGAEIQDFLAKHMTPAQIETAERLAQEWVEADPR
jgi:TPR repeat protein